MSGIPSDCQRLYTTSTEGALQDESILQEVIGSEEGEIFLMVEPGFGFDPENTHTGITLSPDCSSIVKKLGDSIAAARLAKPFRKGTSTISLAFDDVFTY